MDYLVENIHNPFKKSSTDLKSYATSFCSSAIWAEDARFGRFRVLGGDWSVDQLSSLDWSIGRRVDQDGSCNE